MLENRIEKIENDGFVIVNLVLADDTKVDINMADGTEDAVAFEAVALEDYENNGYEVEGLETTTIR